jgi:hypothetical protein
VEFGRLHALPLPRDHFGSLTIAAALRPFWSRHSTNEKAASRFGELPRRQATGD